MPALKSLYVALAAVVLAVVTVTAVLLLGAPPPQEPVGAVSPTRDSTTTAGNSGAPTRTDGASQTTAPTATAPGTREPPAANAKDLTPISVDPDELTGYIWPVQHALITGRMGPREFGAFIIVDGLGVHDGLDLATHCGDKVRAAHDGVVLYAGRNFDPYIGYLGDATPIYARLERLGRTNDQPIVVVIDDGNGYRSMYVHLGEARVEPGTTVSAGDVIGLEGATGYATGCHLHYTMIRMDGGWQEVLPRLARFGYPPYVRERVDPLKVLPWGDEFAPEKLRNRVNGTPSPLPETPSPAAETPSPVAEPSSPPTAGPETAAPDAVTP